MNGQQKQETTNGLPRYINAQGVAKMLGYEKSWFYETLSELEKQGFPKKDPLMKKWSREAIIKWDQCRNGANAFVPSPHDEEPDPFLSAARCFNA